jgi:anti-sigma regulatory factor (Ser/Thr protein kinase)
MAIKTRRGVERQGGHVLKMRLGSGPEAAASARRAISRLQADLDPPLIETLGLLVTELVTNSVRHTAADSLTLSVAIGKSSVLTEVADTGPGFDPQCVKQAGDDGTGWGLFLVQRLAEKWGVTRDGPSKRVWFELRRA